MSEQQVKSLKVIKIVTTMFWLSGFSLFLVSLFASGIKQGYLISISLSIMVSSILTFGFCIFIKIMEEASGKRRAVQRQHRSTSTFVYKKSPQLY
ncbi:hypothetical protein CVD25_07730 [Bacillus canaveralius]|uniref:Uncharacterized protein n=1 Tax=Bacillus canaveralius TaxID=1403243 RepID=A0A2N5GS38_9BACI|nr:MULTISPECIES: hypothetical protein [Bacillus]PLR86368.1 hypothetical protein CU635_01885 [Bacillus canaveralius]PLR86601.1 hypothetical protein CVD23_06190 [Bacillus sp. V33-4]PLR98601.1 hypothetical protein CVD25_07730 [Bacillus canaveralius]